ncbi:hypothetical protein F4678DRAFT_328437 [Xylaria arbuscula]|nr:hypothetical protein F4678DRAFT_328437 [Xylaria arbuscula]
MGQKWGALECGLSRWLRRLGRPNSGVLPTLGQRVRHRRARLVPSAHLHLGAEEHPSTLSLLCLSVYVSIYFTFAFVLRLVLLREGIPCTLIVIVLRVNSVICEPDHTLHKVHHTSYLPFHVTMITSYGDVCAMFPQLSCDIRFPQRSFASWIMHSAHLSKGSTHTSSTHRAIIRTYSTVVYTSSI